MTTTWSETDLLRELNPVVEGELNRHLKVAKEWFPHEYIPWSEGRNFDGLMGGDAWSPEDSPMSDVARSALVVNLLTEDNLPSYHHEIATIFGRDDAWGAWVAPVDRRGGPPRHRHARLPARQAVGRPH